VYNNCNVNILTGLKKPKTQQLSHANAIYRLLCLSLSFDKSNVFVNILTYNEINIKTTLFTTPAIISQKEGSI
jgi:hypothetical protein